MNTTKAMDTDPGIDWNGSWPHVTALFVTGGDVMLGRVEPIHDVAVAADDCKVFATFKRIPGSR